MIAAIDVHYRKRITKAVAITFENWDATEPIAIHEAWIAEVAAYIPGQFYKRELPCILKVVAQLEIAAIDVLLIDGYVFLDDNKKCGLGMYVYEHFQRAIPVIGVAKRAFKNNKKQVREVLRGTSKQPLFVTSVGVDVEEAAANILKMSGKYRMPTLLKRLDQTTKS